MSFPRLKNGWTGGQYSLFRGLFGLYLAIHFLHLLPWGPELFSNAGALPDPVLSPLAKLFPNIFWIVGSPWAVRMVLGTGAALAMALMVGWRDRLAALLLWYLWACLYTRDPFIANPSLPFVGWMLLAHACLPEAPYGSWRARGRVDPQGGWRFPEGIFFAAWAVMAVGYSYSGISKLVSPSWVDGSAVLRVLENPLARPTPLRDLALAMPPFMLKLATWGGLGLELFYAPLALSRRARPWIWALMVAMHLGLLALIAFPDLSVAMLLLHLFTFDPAWIPAKEAAATETLFYDGHCGLCHRAVRFALAEDRVGTAFRFAPLQGETFAAAVPEAQRATLPDSVVLLCRDGTLLVRSGAILRLLARLGGLWRVASFIGGLVPSPLRDGLYNVVAGVRKRIFAAPSEACPILTPDQRKRFLP